MNQNPREQAFLFQIKKYTIKGNLAIYYLHSKTKLVAGIFLDFDWQQVDTKEVNLTEELQRQDVFTENRPSGKAEEKGDSLHCQQPYSVQSLWVSQKQEPEEFTHT